MTHIGDNMRRLREQRGMTLTELAESTEISRSQLTKIEKGSQKNPGIETLVALATALGTPIEELVFGERNETAEMKAQLKAIMELKPEQREVAKQMLRTWFMMCKTDDMKG